MNKVSIEVQNWIANTRFKISIRLKAIGGGFAEGANTFPDA